MSTFRVTYSDGTEHMYRGDSSFHLDAGVLEVLDSETGEHRYFSPTAWQNLTESEPDNRVYMS